ncbi:hypothetical protein E4665_07090 [Sporolactobacillus shoreae]|uniref:Uncharacterized protein n=1 Tax=Sporolactobacillus shoreae TaxID=1465501 RepID=A0A4Z0GR17_9BACL|nr:hypothetical protein [Sporolactobacillus shoreae]TGA98622.1 hypothetical protein E4665_07090 [Sporolactobacillus shoreae]
MENKDRSTYFWRYDGNPDARQRINIWMDQQSNVRNSLKMLVLYFADRFGNKNVMDYDVQKQLYADVLNLSQSSSENLTESREKLSSSPPVRFDGTGSKSSELDNILNEVDLKNI